VDAVDPTDFNQQFEPFSKTASVASSERALGSPDFSLALLRVCCSLLFHFNLH
jgi:hypothetical protein